MVWVKISRSSGTTRRTAPRGARQAGPDLPDCFGENPGPTVGQVLAVHGGHHRMAQPHPGDRLPHPARLVGINVAAPAAALHGAEGAGSGAGVTQDHEGGGTGVPALAEVGAAR